MKATQVLFFGILIILSLIFMYAFFDQQSEEDYTGKVQKFRREKDDFLRKSKDSPLAGKDLEGHLHYFEPNPQYRFVAKIEREEKPQDLYIPMTDSTRERYISYGMATFRFQGQEHRLQVFVQAKNPSNFFIPFTDLSNGGSTYEGGRYLDVERQDKAREIVLDFNFAYNPFCVYNIQYVCPIPPKENHLNFEVLAGEQKYHEGEAHD